MQSSCGSVSTGQTPRLIETKIPGHALGNDSEYYAVICACSRYENRKYDLPRPFPAPDSKLSVVYDALMQTKNWDKDHVILLLNENATKQNITDALERMSTKVGPNDILVCSCWLFSSRC